MLLQNYVIREVWTTLDEKLLSNRLGRRISSSVIAYYHATPPQTLYKALFAFRSFYQD